MLTDDDATGITAAKFGPYLKDNVSKLGAVRVSGFVGLANSAQSSTCRVAGIGQSYIALAADPAVGGMIADICNSNWTGLLNELASQVKNHAGKSNVVTLSGKPSNASSLVVKVDGQSFTTFIFEAPSKVILDASKLTPVPHKVEVSYQ